MNEPSKNTLSGEELSRFHRDGYLLIPSVFSPDEMNAFESAGRASPGTVNANTLLSLVPGLQDLWCDPRLVAIAKSLLGSTPVFFGEANYARYTFKAGENMKGRHLHHDAKGTRENIFNRLHDVLHFTYPVVRLGVYFQDYREQSGGLKVTPGSHRTATHQFHDAQFEHVNIASKPGDVVCFTLRILHSPFGMRLKSDPALALAPSQEEKLFSKNPDLFLPSPVEREAMFIDFAACHELADIHIKSRALNTRNAKEGIASLLSDGVFRDRAAREGVGLRYDLAIVETIVALSNAARSDGLRPQDYSYLEMLSSLCKKNEEWSDYFPIGPRIIPDYSAGAASELYSCIVGQINAYDSMKNRYIKDEHMFLEQAANA